MGYTHYWDHSPIAAAKWEKFTKWFSALVMEDEIPPLTRDEDYPMPPMIDKEHLLFNGVGEDGHETFYFDRNDRKKGTDFEFCKTAYKPYDIVVVACLAYLAHFCGVNVRSDGGMDDWSAGVALANRVSDVTIPNPLG